MNTLSVPGRCAAARFVLFAAAALLFAAGADAAQQLTVTAANALRDSVYDLTLSGGGLINGTQPINSDGASHGAFAALAWAPNSVTGTLDLIAADSTKGQIVRYAGPHYGTSSVIFAYTKKGSGPSHPVGLTVDAGGNLFVISPSNPLDTAPSLWALPFNTTTGAFGAPLLIDHSFGGVRTLALAEVLVAGTAATVHGSSSPAWNAGDLLVLVGDTFNDRVIVYSQAAINGVLANPDQPLSGPTSTAVSQSQFLNLLAIPFGMDIWPADATHGVSLLVSTIDGRILRFDSASGAFTANFAAGLGLGLQKIKVGSAASTPYAFVAQLGLFSNGTIQQFGAPPASGANKALVKWSQGVTDPIGLAVSGSDSTPAGACIAPNTCTLLGGALAQQISGAGSANIPPAANVLAQSCTVPVDPRVSISGGTWSCLSPQMTVCSGTQTTNCVSPTLDVADYCPGFPHTVLPASLCGHSGPSGAGFEVVESTSVTVDQNANNTFIQTTVDPDVSLPGPFNLSCPQNPIYAWAPRSDRPNVEGTVPEDLALPDTFIDLSGYCDKGGGASKVASMYAFGLALNTAPSGLGSGPTNGLFGFVTTKFSNLTATITAAGSQVNGGTAATLQGYVNQAQAFFNSSFQNDVPSGYSCAMNTLASADNFVRANLSAFSFAQPPAGNPNPAGDVDGRLANLFLSIGNYFLMQPPNETWPTTNVPPCVSITATPASVPSGTATTLSWGPATTSFPLSFPPQQCTLSASDGTFTTPAIVGPSGSGVSSGILSTVGTYTAALQCTGAPGNPSSGGATSEGLATTAVTVTPPSVLVSLAVSPAKASIGDFFNQQFSAKGTFSGAVQDLTGKIIWSAGGAATIDSNGLAFCASTGSATITATVGAIQGSATLTCQHVLSSLSTFVQGGNTTVKVGGTLTITARAAYTDGSTADVSSSATWVSTNPKVASVSKGVVKALCEGTTTIYASVNDPISGLVKSGAVTITVTKKSYH
ncbi:MAG TPA: Ig-like domain-containing protein [Steroidobacteraceae bacterium]|jgi:hypothetical protein|nr:Ig-like domain-containing protein [Steroidobacteraceae bacterium]